MDTHAGPNANATYTVKRMAGAVIAFLSTLRDEEKAAAHFQFEGTERYEWNYTPTPRKGLMLRDMNIHQREAALRMMDTAYSSRGIEQAHDIIALETTLGEWEATNASPSKWERSPERYWFSVFGFPSKTDPWGFRIGGHHIGLSITVVGDMVTSNPLFFGVNPAEVKHGDLKGKRVLAAEEDMARNLLMLLSPDQKRTAIVESVAPSDILTRNYRVTNPDTPLKGISFDLLSDRQRESLLSIIRHYVDRSADQLAANYWRRLESAGWGNLSFAWAGPEARGEGHYYSISNRIFAIEYDNTQNGANHIHSVLRDFTNDWGEDLLATHYKENH